MLENYSRVRLQTEKYAPLGAAIFDIGYIIETYPNGDYEVEFSDKSGMTTAQIVAREEELELETEWTITAPTPVSDPSKITNPSKENAPEKIYEPR